MINTNDYPKVKAIIDSLPFGVVPDEEMNNIIVSITDEYKSRVSLSHFDATAVNGNIERNIDKYLAELTVLVDKVILQTRAKIEAEHDARAERDAEKLEASNAIRTIVTLEMMEIEKKAPEYVKQNKWFKSWLVVEQQRRITLYLGGL